MTTITEFFRSIGLLIERLHIIGADTTQAAGYTCRWTQNLVPIGERMVAAGELVELHVRVDQAHPIAADPEFRFDILEFDWLFFGGFDDPMSSLKTPGARAPIGDYIVSARSVANADYTADRPSLREIVDAFRVEHGADFESNVLVVRETDRPADGGTDVITWWRARHATDESAPTLYFNAELPPPVGHPDQDPVRDSSTVALRVAPLQPGVNLRLYGTLIDTVPAATADAQPVPDAVITLGTASTRTTAAGTFAFDARLPVGASTITVARLGIDTRTLNVQVNSRADGGYDVAVVDADAANQQLAADTVAADADDQSAFTAQLTLRARVHRVSGTVSWPMTWQPAAGPIPLAGRTVYALPLATGPALPQRPMTSRDWAALRTRRDVLRSARPDRPKQKETTDVDGRFELSFLDLRPGHPYLVWAESSDPRGADRPAAPDVIVRTVHTDAMRRLNFPGATMTPLHDERMIVNSDYTLLRDDATGIGDVVRVVNVDATGAAADFRLVRPPQADPARFDATPPTGVAADPVDPNLRAAVDATTMRAAGLALEVLPLAPVFEPAEAQSAYAAWATRMLRDQLDARFPRGALLGATRWVLDARRSPTPATWDDRASCTRLETTLLSHPLLDRAHITSTAWGWWRADAVSAADFAELTEPAAATYDNRRLVSELIPVVTTPVPRLLGLFERRHLHISPGHGVFQSPATAATVGSNRPSWAGYAAGRIENWAGEDENTAGLAREVCRVADANGIVTTSSREARDPTRLGHVQRPVGTFTVVDPVLLPDFPRLWQLNACYWLAAEWNPNNAANAVAIAPFVNAQGGNMERAAIDARMALFSQQAADPDRPVNIFLALHTNAAAGNNRGLLAMYYDIRQNLAAPGPGAAGYVERNTVGQRFATLLAAEIANSAPLHGSNARSYFEVKPTDATTGQPNPVRELFATVTHYNNGHGWPADRTIDQIAGHAQTVFPRPGGADLPIGYSEVGFHDNTGDAANLAQGWFRFAMGVGVARAVEQMLGEHPSAVTGDDVVALLRRTFGNTGAVTALAGGVVQLTPAEVAAMVSGVTRRTPQPNAPAQASALLGDVVQLIQDECNATTREQLVDRVSDAIAALAGYSAADQAEDRARACLGPVLRGLGAPAPAAGAVPTIADLPRSAQPPTRTDAAAAICSGLGLRPGTLAKATASVHGVTVFPAAVPEAPDAFLSGPGLTDLVAAIGTLEPEGCYHLVTVRLTDRRGNPRPAPYSVVAGEDVYLVIETAGATWRATAADISVVVSRAGATVATLGCANRTLDAITTAAWTVTAPGMAGAQDYSVTATIKHPNPTVGSRSLDPVKVSLAVTTP